MLTGMDYDGPALSHGDELLREQRRRSSPLLALAGPAGRRVTGATRLIRVIRSPRVRPTFRPRRSG